MRRILFVCKYNRFRSKTAEGFFNKLNKNPKYRAESAGIFIGDYPLEKTQEQIVKEYGAILKGRPRGISSEMLRTFDYLVVVADNVPHELFRSSRYIKGKVINWDIPDAKPHELAKIRKSIIMILNKVEKFVKQLK